MKRTRLPRKSSVKVIPNPTGPAGMFKFEYIEEARELVGKLGATREDLGLYFGVHEDTIKNWAHTYPDFNSALRKGRLEACLKASQALFQRAVGCAHLDTQFFIYKGEIISKTYMKHYPPDASAAHKYLTIMYREVWADNKVTVNHLHSGTVNHRKIEDIPLHELTSDQQELLFTLNMKQLSGPQQN